MLAETLIKDNCTYLTPAPDFHLAALDWFNDEADKVETWPVCLMENVTPGKPLITSRGVTEQTYDIALFFLHSFPANEGEDINKNPEIGSVRHTAVDNMRKLAEDLLQSLFKDTRIVKPSEAITGALIRSVYSFMDLSLDGVSLNFSLKLQTSPNCFTRHSGPMS